MARLIDADKLKKHYAWWKGGTLEKTLDEMKRDFDTIVDLQPTVQAEPKHDDGMVEHYAEMERHRKRGRWKGAGMGDYMCSLCAEVVSGNRWHYCPNCGAKMDLTE